MLLFPVFKGANMKVTVLWIAAACSLVKVNRPFRGFYSLLLESEYLSNYTKQQPRNILS
jgi:hypothetical protein